MAPLTARCTHQLPPTVARTCSVERRKKGEDYKRREGMERKWKGKENKYVERREVDCFNLFSPTIFFGLY